MNLAETPFTFHDGALASFQVGPRRELTLHIWLNPISNQPAGTIELRLGAVTNMEQVSQFFDQLKPPTGPDRFVDGISELSQPSRRIVRLELESHGSVEIHSEKISIQRNQAPVPDSPSSAPFSVASVLADLVTLDRQTITVRGLLAVQRENRSLADSARDEPAQRLWVNFHYGPLGLRERDLDSFDRFTVLATGTLSRQKKGHFGLFPATLTICELARV